MDLWPEDLTNGIDELKPPVNILKEQGIALGEKTRNLVEGKTYAVHDNFADNFEYVFSINAPALRYNYDLLKISYDIAFYPLELKFEDSVKTVNTEEEFMNSIKEIFSASKTKQVIRALLSQLEFRPAQSQEYNDGIPF